MENDVEIDTEGSGRADQQARFKISPRQGIAGRYVLVLREVESNGI
jgi:hypothetical protein